MSCLLVLGSSCAAPAPTTTPGTLTAAKACAGTGQESGTQDAAPSPDRATTDATPSDERALDRVRLVPGDVVGLPTPESRNFAGGVDGSAGRPSKDDSGRFVVAPIPFVSPTIGSGLALGGAYLFRLDPESPPSVLGGGAMYSDNDSAGGALGFKGYLGADRYRVTAALAATRLNVDLTTDTGVVPLQENIVGGKLEVLVRSFERVYIGPQVIAAGIDTDLRREEDVGVIPDDQLDANNFGLGLRTQRDTRDSTFYPRTGSLADAQVTVFDEALGSAFDFQVVPIAYNHYLGPGERDVIALRASARFALGDVPFYAESYFGTNSDLRGYTVGTLHDKILLAAQAEYRRELFWRIGAVAFAGVGTVTPTLAELDEADALPSVGLGVRLTLEEKNHVNFRVDFAWGKDQSAVYVGVGEAF